MDPREQALIESHLGGCRSMLEWGAGGSTKAFSGLVDHYYSIEHNEDWANKVRADVPPNVTLIHQPPEWPQEKPFCSDEGQYESYVRASTKFEVDTFDAILIDGRARIECLRQSLHHSNKGGLIFFHDFWLRKRYWGALEEFFQDIQLIDGVTSSFQTLAVFRRL